MESTAFLKTWRAKQGTPRTVPLFEEAGKIIRPEAWIAGKTGELIKSNFIPWFSRL